MLFWNKNYQWDLGDDREADLLFASPAHTQVRNLLSQKLAASKLQHTQDIQHQFLLHLADIK